MSSCANKDDQTVFFVVAFSPPQPTALYGAIFIGKAEGGFSNYRFWESLGFLIAYVLQTQVRWNIHVMCSLSDPFSIFQICIAPKLWILVGFLTSGMVGYLWVERLERVV